MVNKGLIVYARRIMPSRPGGSVCRALAGSMGRSMQCLPVLLFAARQLASCGTRMLKRRPRLADEVGLAAHRLFHQHGTLRADGICSSVRGK